jgi:hypothetical protein
VKKGKTKGDYGEAEVTRIAIHLAAFLLGAAVLAGVALLFVAALIWLGVL